MIICKLNALNVYNYIEKNYSFSVQVLKQSFLKPPTICFSCLECQGIALLNPFSFVSPEDKDIISKITLSKEFLLQEVFS